MGGPSQVSISDDTQLVYTRLAAREGTEIWWHYLV